MGEINFSPNTIKKDDNIMQLVVVTQNGCNPCTMLKDHLSREGIEFSAFNIHTDEHVVVADEKLTMDDLSIMSSPVTILFDDNEEIARVAGFKPSDTSDIDVLIEQM
jgi:glutaredoxin